MAEQQQVEYEQQEEEVYMAQEGEEEYEYEYEEVEGAEEGVEEAMSAAEEGKEGEEEKPAVDADGVNQDLVADAEKELNYQGNGVEGDELFAANENHVFTAQSKDIVDVADSADEAEKADEFGNAGGELAEMKQELANMADGADSTSARATLYDLCNLFEDCAECIHQHALMDPENHVAMEDARDNLLNELYQLRYLADVDDDFFQAEFEREMRKLKQYRLKMGRLGGKEDVNKDSSDESSDDTEGDDDWVTVLKQARKTMQYAFGKLPDALAYRSDMRAFAKNYNSFNYYKDKQ